MRVLHLIYDHPRNPWVGGGGAVRAWELYRRLAPVLPDVTVVTGNFPGAQEGREEGFQLRPIGRKGPYALSRWSFAQGASRLLREGEYDVAIQDFSVYTPIRVPRNAPIGTLVHHLTGPSARSRWGWPLGPWVANRERRALGLAHSVAVPSRATGQALRELVPQVEDLRVIPNGVPDELFQLPREASYDLLFFGRLDWFQKGIDVLLDAMVQIRSERPGVQLRVAGRGRDMERVEREVAARGLQGQVTLLGAVSEEERDRLFSGARILVMPSRFEGFGMVAAEAMAAGVPVIASDVDALVEVVDPPNGGVVVPVGDAAALAHSALRLLGDPAERGRLSERARTSAERFRWDQIAREHLAWLNQIRAGSTAQNRRESV